VLNIPVLIVYISIGIDLSCTMKSARIVEIAYCLSCPYCIYYGWTEEHLCQLSDREVIGVDVETEIMDGCKLPLLKDIKR